jgi:predicted membrane protein
MFSILEAWHSSRSSVDAVGSRFEHRDDATRQTHDRPPDAPAEVSESVELRKEAWVMALYVAVCLLAALSAVAEKASDGHVRAIAIVWGTTVGLALAHAFAFRVSARIVAQGRVRRHDADAIVAQLIGATGVAVLATIPILLWPATAEFDVVRWTLALFISFVGFEVARSSGAGRGRSLAYGATLLVAAVTIAVLKNILSGH